MHAKAWTAAATLTLAATLPAAQAADIRFDATPLGGTSWRYDYAVTNTDLPGLDQFSIFFENSSFANLAVTASPAGWSSIVLQPNSEVDGLFDSLALIDSLPQGATVGGFSVTFDYLLDGTPGVQDFQIVDPFDSGAILQEGVTRPIPEPQSLALMLAGLAPMAWWARRRRR